jgi:hypothetical protein
MLRRRGFLGLGLAAAALRILPPGPLSGAEENAEPGGKLFLFVDWFHVKKGDLRVRLDPARLNDEGRKQLENLARDFNRVFEQGEHGFRAADVPFGVRIVPERAERSQPWLVADRPWEAGVQWATVLHDEGRYRCWYHARLRDESSALALDRERGVELRGTALAYAESADGWTWTKPALDVLSYRGSRANNLVSPFANAGSVCRDDHGAAEERYKGFFFDELPKGEVPAGAPAAKRYGLYGVSSHDGYHWTRREKPLVRYFCDTLNVAAWDPLLGKYVGYFRHHLSGRTISRAETDDFWSWPEPQPWLYGGPLDAPADDFYTNCYTTYPGEPSLRLLFPAIYHRDTDSVDVRMAVSRDGRAFQWVSYEPILTLGRAGEWDGGSLYASPNLVSLPDGRMALPFDAHDHSHNESWFKLFYGNYPSTTRIAWALWRDARLAGIQAAHIGEFTTNAARFDGSRIQLNARTGQAGGVTIELREKGKAVDGFTFADAVPISGDAVWSTCRWKGREDLGTLRGKSLELALRLRDATVFACRFV